MNPVSCFQYRRYRRFFLSGVVKSAFLGGIIGNSFSILGGIHLPILDIAWSLIGVTPSDSHGPSFFRFSILFWPIWLGGILNAWFHFRARVHEKDLQRIYNVYNSVYKNSLGDEQWWETYKNETLIPILTQQELNGTLRFPTWKERKKQDEREFAFRNFVAYQVLKDPEKREKQTLLVESIKHI